MKYAVLSCAGLGDCLITLIVSENLYRAGHEVVTFHPFMAQMQNWFPHLPIKPFPPQYDEFDKFIIIYEKSAWMQKALNVCLSHRRKDTIVLNPIATPHKDYPFWDEGCFDGNLPFGDNLVTFCKNQLKIKGAQKTNGMIVPSSIKRRSSLRQIVIHPTSSRPSKNWPRSKFLKLFQILKKRGYEPIFIVSPAESSAWPEAPAFKDLNEMARCVAESGAMIGNDSGISHLASCLGLPTISLFKNERTARFWQPCFAPTFPIIPRGWLPNVKGLRWRDRYWHWGISVKRVIRAFDEFCVPRNQTMNPR